MTQRIRYSYAPSFCCNKVVTRSKLLAYDMQCYAMVPNDAIIWQLMAIILYIRISASIL